MRKQFCGPDFLNFGALQQVTVSCRDRQFGQVNAHPLQNLSVTVILGHSKRTL